MMLRKLRTFAKRKITSFDSSVLYYEAKVLYIIDYINDATSSYLAEKPWTKTKFEERTSMYLSAFGDFTFYHEREF